jgi:hypothetical protein
MPGGIVHQAWLPAGSMTINIEESGWVVNGLHGGPSQDDIGQTPPPAVTPNFDMRLVGCGGPQHPILAIGREAHSETSSVGLIWRPREFALIAHRNRAKIPQECGASSRLPSHSLLRCPARSAADIGPRRSVRIAASNRFEFEERGLQRFLFFPRLQLSATRGAQALPTVGVTVGDKNVSGLAGSRGLGGRFCRLRRGHAENQRRAAHTTRLRRSRACRLSKL